jgi:hypothetical protein
MLSQFSIDKDRADGRAKGGSDLEKPERRAEGECKTKIERANWRKWCPMRSVHRKTKFRRILY